MNISSPSPSRHNTGAFTLLELLVALGVTGMLVIVLFGIFTQISKAWRTAENRAETYQTARALLDIMARDLSQAVACSNCVYTFTGDGAANTVTFFTAVGPTNGLSDLAKIQYQFSQPTLTRTYYTPAVGGTWSAGSGYDLAPSVVMNCSFTYYTNRTATGATGYASYKPGDAWYRGKPPASVLISLDLLDARSAALFATVPSITNENLRSFSAFVSIPSALQ